FRGECACGPTTALSNCVALSCQLFRHRWLDRRCPTWSLPFHKLEASVHLLVHCWVWKTHARSLKPSAEGPRALSMQTSSVTSRRGRTTRGKQTGDDAWMPTTSNCRLITIVPFQSPPAHPSTTKCAIS